MKPTDDPRQLLPVIPADAAGLNAEAGMHDLGRNGSYLVFRQLAQRVAQFWNFLDKATSSPNGASNPDARDRVGDTPLNIAAFTDKPGRVETRPVPSRCVCASPVAPTCADGSTT